MRSQPAPAPRHPPRQNALEPSVAKWDMGPGAWIAHSGHFTTMAGVVG